MEHTVGKLIHKKNFQLCKKSLYISEKFRSPRGSSFKLSLAVGFNNEQHLAATNILFFFSKNKFWYFFTKGLPNDNSDQNLIHCAVKIWLAMASIFLIGKKGTTLEVYLTIIHGKDLKATDKRECLSSLDSNIGFCNKKQLIPLYIPARFG